MRCLAMCSYYIVGDTKLVVLVLVLVVVVLVSVLVEDGWGQHAAIPHPYLLTPQRPRDMPTG